MSKRIAVVGSGIVAGMATFALRESGYDVMVFSDTGRPTPPPPGAFYLHDLPPVLRDLYPRRRHLETTVGMNPGSYTRRMWNVSLPGSSIDRLWSETDAGKTPRQLVTWRPTAAMLDDLFTGALWAPPQHLAKEDVIGLLRGYDGVVVTVPISFVDARPAVVSMPVVTTSLDVTKLTGDSMLNSVLCLAGVDSAVSLLETYASVNPADGHTIYSARAKDSWLRATKHGDEAQVELMPAVLARDFWDDVLASRHAWSKETRDECLALMQQAVRKVPKIHPREDRRNESPNERLLLTGRWATWERHELSHESYIRTRNWAQIVFRHAA